MTDPNSPTHPRRIIAAERKAKALALRKEGFTYDQIAKECEFSGGRGEAWRAVDSALKELKRDAEDVLGLELVRLDDMYARLSNGRRKGDSRAIDSSLKIMDRRARYLGLDDYEQRMATLAEQQHTWERAQVTMMLTLLDRLVADLGLDPEVRASLPDRLLHHMAELGMGITDPAADGVVEGELVGELTD